MLGKSWQVMPGVGEEYLKTIGDENRVWHRLMGMSDLLTAQTEQLGERASQIGQEVIDAATLADEFGLNAMVNRLGETQKDELVRAYLAARATEQLASLGTKSIPGQDRRARLTVAKPGVFRKRHWFDTAVQPSPESLKDSVELPVGKVIESIFEYIKSCPPVEGVLCASHLGYDTFLHGLVNSPTGEPRVELEILELAPKPR